MNWPRPSSLRAGAVRRCGRHDLLERAAGCGSAAPTRSAAPILPPRRRRAALAHCSDARHALLERVASVAVECSGDPWEERRLLMQSAESNEASLTKGKRRRLFAFVGVALVLILAWLSFSSLCSARRKISLDFMESPLWHGWCRASTPSYSGRAGCAIGAPCRSVTGSASQPPAARPPFRTSAERPATPP